MYRKVAKRLTAWVLVFCMAGGIQDFRPLVAAAAEFADESVAEAQADSASPGDSASPTESKKSLEGSSVNITNKDALYFNVAEGDDGSPVIGVKPDFEVIKDGSTISSDNYDAEYSDYDKPGTATITITGKNQYEGTITANYTILQRSIAADQWNISGNVIEIKIDENSLPLYSQDSVPGKEKFAVCLKHNGMEFWSNSTDAGKKNFFDENFEVSVAKPGESTGSGVGESDVTVTVTAKTGGSYSGSWSETVSLPTDRKLTDANVAAIDPQEYQAGENGVTPEPVVTVGGSVLRKGDDYTVAYENNKSVGTAAKAIITGTGDYTGTVTKTFTIYKNLGTDRSYKDTITSKISPQLYIGKNIELKAGDVKLLDDGKAIASDQYTLEMGDNCKNLTTETTKAKVKVKGKDDGLYRGERELEFEIVPNAKAKFAITLDATEFTYTGGEITPAVTVTLEGDTTVLRAAASDTDADADYKVSYKNHTNVPTGKGAPSPTVVVTGMNGFAGSQGTVTFTIKARALDKDAGKYEYTTPSGPIMINEDGVYDPKVTVKDKGFSPEKELVKDTDYTVSCEPEDSDPSKGTLTITGIGNYSGEVTFSVTLAKRTVSHDNVEVTYNNPLSLTYTGKSILEDPAFGLGLTIKKKLGTDAGKELRYGEDFTIKPVSGTMEDDAHVNYTGNEIPFVIDFSASKEFTGTLEQDAAGKAYSYSIAKKDLDSEDVIIDAPGAVDDGSENITTTVTVTYNGMTLKQGTDYTLKYGNNSSSAVAKGDKPYVEITAVQGNDKNYTGTKRQNFTIGQDIGNATVTFQGADKIDGENCYTYQAEPILPTVIVKMGDKTLHEGDDYILDGRNNENISIGSSTAANKVRATLIIKAIGDSYVKTKEVEFRIISKNATGTKGGTVSFKESLQEEFTGSPITLEGNKMVFTNTKGNKYTLQEFDENGKNKDYELTYDSNQDNINAGSIVEITVRFVNNFMNTKDGLPSPNTERKKVTCKIVPKPFQDAERTATGDIYIQFDQDSYALGNQTEVKPSIKVIDLKRNAGTGTYKKNGSLDDKNAYVLGETDYEISYSNNRAPGIGKVTIRGKGNYKNELITKEFRITGNVSDDGVTFVNPKPDEGNDIFKYTGKNIRPEVEVRIGTAKIDPKNYECEYPEECKELGYYIVKIKFTEAYKKENPDAEDIDKIYQIVQRDINDATVETLGSYAWTGKVIEPDPKVYFKDVILERDVDYTVTYDDAPCIDVNTVLKPYYTITVRGIGNFTGFYTKKAVTFKIGKTFTKDNIEVTVLGSYTYTGETIIPDIRVRDKKRDVLLSMEDGDYGIAIDEGNPEYINAGAKTFRVYGLPTNYPYVGDVEARFTIESISLSDTSAIVVDEEKILSLYYEYDGYPKNLEPSVCWHRRTENGIIEQKLSVENEDFTYSYKNNTNAGDAEVIIGQGKVKPGGQKPNFINSQTHKFKIHPIKVRDDGDLSITDTNDWTYVYTGKKLDPAGTELVYKYPDESGVILPLKKGTDYDVVSDAVNVAEGVRVEFVLKGNFQREPEGAANIYRDIYKITPCTIEEKMITWPRPSYKYTSRQIRPVPTIKYNGLTLAEGTDFSLEYGTNINAGASAGTVTVNGITGNYQGSYVYHFDIAKINLNSSDIRVEVDDGAIPLGGTEARPKFVVYWKQENGAEWRVYPEDDQEAFDKGWERAFTYEYYNNTQIGQDGTLKLLGIGNFEGTLEKTFPIRNDINDYIESVEWVTEPKDLEFNNTSQKPSLNIVPNALGIQQGITKDHDFEIAYEPVSPTGDSECVNAGEYVAFVRGIGKYAGRSEELRYTIAQRDISKVTFTVSGATYTGSRLSPEIIATDEGLEPSLVLERVSQATDVSGPNAYLAVIKGDIKDVGKYSFVINAVESGNYKGTVREEFSVVPKSLTDASIDAEPWEIDEQEYTGSAITPAEFKIVDTARRNEDGEAVTPGTGDYVLTPADYGITYSDNVYPGVCVITIEGKGNYQDSFTREFRITADLSLASVAEIPVQRYTGERIEPELNITFAGKPLVLNQDYKVKYENNINRGTAKVIITPADLSVYRGEKIVFFEIGRDLEEAQFQIVSHTYTYTGSAIVPQIAVLYGGEILTNGKDYTVTYSNNVNVGTANILVTGAGSYSGTIKGTFQIVAKSVTRCSYSGVETKLYDKNATSQNLSVQDGSRTLVPGQDYSVKYINNVNPGTATIEITGLGNYGGIKTIRYNIEVKPMTKISAKAKSSSTVKLSWPAVDGAEGYSIYNASNNKRIANTKSTSYTHKKLTGGKTYKYKVRPYKVSDGGTYYGDFSNTVKAVTNPKAPKIKLKAGKGQVKVSWKKISGANGYEVYRSTKKSKGYKKVATIKKASTVKYTNKKLKKNKKYYFKVRAYKIVNKKKLYSSYSSPKQVKVK